MKCWIKKSEFAVFMVYDPKRNRWLDKRIYRKRIKKFFKS